MPKTRKDDPFDLERRLETQIHLHLLEMEEHPELIAAKERLSAITTIGMWLNRKFGWGEPEDTKLVGSAVRKYRGAFQTSVSGQNASGQRATGSRSPARSRANSAADTDADAEC